MFSPPPAPVISVLCGDKNLEGIFPGMEEQLENMTYPQGLVLFLCGLNNEEAEMPSCTEQC